MQFSSIKESSLYVQCLSRTEDFYAGKLKMKVIGRKDGRHIFFRVGDSVLLCFVAESTLKEEGFPPHGAKGVIHLAFEVDAGKYESIKHELKNAGIEIVAEQDWPKGLKSCYFHDPDGHLLEIVPRGLWD